MKRGEQLLRDVQNLVADASIEHDACSNEPTLTMVGYPTGDTTPLSLWFSCKTCGWFSNRSHTIRPTD